MDRAQRICHGINQTPIMALTSLLSLAALFGASTCLQVPVKRESSSLSAPLTSSKVSEVDDDGTDVPVGAPRRQRQHVPLQNPFNLSISRLPRVFMLPLPEEFRACARGPPGRRRDSEYDQDIEFNEQLRRFYPRKADDVQSADLVYVAYSGKSKLCDGKSPRKASLQSKLADMIRAALAVNPHVRFFSAVGAVCTCGEGCHPLGSHHPLRRSFRIIAWERGPLPNYTTNVVMPYMVDGVSENASIRGARRLLVLNTAQLRGQKEYTGGGICGEGSEGWKTLACRNYRSEVMASLSSHEGEPDVGIMVTGHQRNTEIYKGKYPDAIADSVFCLQPPGDTLTRRSFYQSIVYGCIPVVFREDDAFVSQFAFYERVPYRAMWLHVPGEAVLNGADIVQILRAVPSEVVEKKQALLRQWGPVLDFTTSVNADRAPLALLMSVSAMWSAFTEQQNRTSKSINLELAN
eukprot:TRINITY_DN64886_c0_g1_i1.p1 TRINITY_DN64886_c0_g1~~TRINITY_DN64886_c0_g1_i1.p1  ORF type:complete len:472 (+),score=24.68 TRINITY_DN64886_c0_g1_i1:28-1416(+)